MNASRSSYEKDLPDDLLELIDHTTRGVQRLYESTCQRETAGGARAWKPAVDVHRAPHYMDHLETSNDGAHVGSNTAAVAPPLIGISRKASVEESHKNSNNRRHQQKSSKSNGTENGGRNGGHRWPWSRVQALPTGGGVADERSGISTANTTMSSDASYRHSSTHHKEIHTATTVGGGGGHHVSITSTVNTSSTAADDENNNTRSSLKGGQRWKDTFKALLSGEAAAAATPTTQLNPAVPSAHVNARQQEAEATIAPPTSSTPLNSTDPKQHQDPCASALAQSNAALDRLRRQLEEQGALHQEELSRLRMEHDRELAELRQSSLEARQRAEEEVTTQLQASFNVKLKLFQAAVDNERMKADEAGKLVDEKDKTIDRLKTELESAASHNKLLRGEVEAKKKQVVELRDVLSSLRRQMIEVEDEVGKRKRDLSESNRREKLMKEREQEALDLVSRLEMQLREQDKRSREELHRLEGEFHTTTKSYQDLVGEATQKLTKLEKVERKYHTLKEQHRTQKQHQEELASKLTSAEEEKTKVIERTEALQQEMEQLRLQIARKEHEMREERAAHHKIVEGITQRLEEEGMKANSDLETLQKALHHAEERTVRLQREVESLAEQLKEEQAHSKELLVQLEQSAIRHQEDISTARRAASKHQQQTEGVLASLKRQLREKDAKLEALATTASEPIQRLRSQLEDERSKRAHLEEQFSRYKEKAKVAKDAALREVRREQQRIPSVTRSQSRPTARLSSISSARDGDRESHGVSSTTLHVSGGNTTPTGQRAPKPLAPPNPQSYNRSREGKNMTPPRSAIPAAGWDSVESISNISRSSPLCSSRSEIIGVVEPAVEHSRETPQGMVATIFQSPQSDNNMDDRVRQHERLLQDFHQSAAEVFRKITGNRDDFLAKCTSVVRSVSYRAADEHLTTGKTLS